MVKMREGEGVVYLIPAPGWVELPHTNNLVGAKTALIPQTSEEEESPLQKTIMAAFNGLVEPEAAFPTTITTAVGEMVLVAGLMIRRRIVVARAAGLAGVKGMA